VRETEWLDAMIDRVLSWRAAAKDRGLAELQCGSIRPVVDEAAARFLRMVAPDEVQLRLSFENVPAVRHDPRALEQALLNLLVNAWKYSVVPKRIGVEVRGQGPWAVVTVEDNGIGIPGGEVRRIFEPFYRVKGAAATTSGAGLGLAIVHHVVKAHGGHIAVDTREGEGSRFSIFLPVAAAGEGRR
jgi:two-component system phosphate regulon sensor histidine kinase PhoR